MESKPDTIKASTSLKDEVSASYADLYVTIKGSSIDSGEETMKKAKEVNQLVEEMNVIPDFRAPDNLRLGFAPLYLSFADVWEGFDRIRRVIEEKRYEKYPKSKLTVT